MSILELRTCLIRVADSFEHSFVQGKFKLTKQASQTDERILKCIWVVECFCFFCDEPSHGQTLLQKRKNEVTKTSPFYRLDPFVDRGLLRVGGRLNHADIPEESKHPVILPRKSHVTTLIIRHTHEQLGHAGRGHVLSKLSERYWIIKATILDKTT